MQKEWTKATLAKTIDHTLLKAIATEQSVRELCAEARKYGFASVCVNPCWVELCAKELSGSGIVVCTVIGFPLGANATETKAAEARLAVAQGAREIDMVINLGAAKAGDWKAVEEDIRGVVGRWPRPARRASSRPSSRPATSTTPRRSKACEAAARAGRPLREDEHRLRHGRRERRGRAPHTQDRRRQAPGQGLGRHPQLPRRHPRCSTPAPTG